MQWGIGHISNQSISIKYSNGSCWSIIAQIAFQSFYYTFAICQRQKQLWEVFWMKKSLSARAVEGVRILNTEQWNLVWIHLTSKKHFKPHLSLGGSFRGNPCRREGCDPSATHLSRKTGVHFWQEKSQLITPQDWGDATCRKPPCLFGP